MTTVLCKLNENVLKTMEECSALLKKHWHFQWKHLQWTWWKIGYREN
jgi:hypothetical protein